MKNAARRFAISFALAAGAPAFAQTLNHVSFIDQTNTQAPVVFWTFTSNTDLYRVSVYLVVTAAGSTCGVASTVQWPDETGLVRTNAKSSRACARAAIQQTVVVHGTPGMDLTFTPQDTCSATYTAIAAVEQVVP